MKRNTVSALAAFLLVSGLAASAQEVPIKKSRNPAFSVMLGIKPDIYYVEDFNANVARVTKAWTAQLDPAANPADLERTKIELLASVKLKLIDAQIGAMLFKQFCDREGVIVADADVTAYIARLRSQVGAASDAEVEEGLAVAQRQVLDLRTYTHQSLLLRRYIQTKREAELKALKGPTPEEILKTYEQMKAEGSLSVPETARYSRLALDIRGKGPEDRKKAMETMRALAAKIKDDKGYFDNLLLGALDPSTGVSARSSSVLMNIKGAPYNFDPKLVDPIFKLKPGEISGVIEAEDALLIARLNDLTPAKVLALYDPLPGAGNATVQDLIVDQLDGMAQEAFAVKIKAEILDKLRNEATVDIVKASLKGIIGDAELESMASRYSKKK